MAGISFASDLDFLKANTEVTELGVTPQTGVVVASARQGRIMTSTLSGPEGPSRGWFKVDTHAHQTCRFKGPFDALNDLSVKVLGVDLNKLL